MESGRSSTTRPVGWKGGGRRRRRGRDRGVGGSGAMLRPDNRSNNSAGDSGDIPFESTGPPPRILWTVKSSFTLIFTHEPRSKPGFLISS